MNEGTKRHKETTQLRPPFGEELLDSYRYLASILESMLDPVIVANPDGTIRTVNPATLELLGYTEKEILGKPVGKIFEEDFFRGTGLARLVYEGVARDIAVTLRAKSGERIPVVFNGSVIREKDGRLIAVVIVARDMRERLRAEEALERRATQLQALSEVGREITSLLDLDPLLDRIVNLIHETFGYPYVTLLLVDPATEKLVFKAGAGYELGPAKAAHLRVGREGVCGWVAGSGEPLLVNDVSQEPRYYPLKVPGDTRAELGVPIKVKGQVVGVVDVQSPELGVFDEDDLFLLQTLADQVGTAIENARLYRQLQEAVVRITRLYELSTELGEGLGLEETLNVVIQKVLAATGAHSAMINLLDKEGNLKFRVGMGVDGKRLEGEPLPRPGGTTDSICRTGKPLIVSGLGKEDSLIHPSLRKRGIKAFIGLPLKTKERSIGALFVRYETPRSFSEDEVRVLSLFASRAAVAIENAQLYTGRERRITELAALNQIGQTLSSTLEFNALLELIYRQVNRVMDAKNLLIALYNEEKDEVSFPLYYEAGKLIEGASRRGRAGLTECIIHTKKPLLFSNISAEENKEKLKQLGVTELFGKPAKSWLGVPMIVGDRVIGVIGIQSYTEEGIYDEGHLELLSTVANQAAIAIENARLFGETEHLRSFNKSIVEGMDEAILIENAEGIITFVNPAAEKLTGYTREELIGLHWSFLIPEEQIEKVKKEAAKRPHGIKSRYEATLLRKDKVRIPVIVSARPLFEDSSFVGVLSALTDITERVRAEEELKKSLLRLRKALEGTVHALAATAEMRDPYTAGHQRRVAELASAIAKEMGLPREQIEGIHMAGLIHDIGKISVPAEILSKPSKLNKMEMDLIKTHSQVGYDILKGIDFPWPIAEIVLQHHERLDRSGYPQGLKDDEILLEARILAVADVVEAMSSHRPYRPALGIDAALDEIKKGKGRLYDPNVVDACLAVFKKGFSFA